MRNWQRNRINSDDSNKKRMFAHFSIHFQLRISEAEKSIFRNFSVSTHKIKNKGKLSQVFAFLLQKTAGRYFKSGLAK